MNTIALYQRPIDDYAGQIRSVPDISYWQPLAKAHLGLRGRLIRWCPPGPAISVLGSREIVVDRGRSGPGPAEHHRNPGLVAEFPRPLGRGKPRYRTLVRAGNRKLRLPAASHAQVVQNSPEKPEHPRRDDDHDEGAKQRTPTGPGRKE